LIDRNVVGELADDQQSPASEVLAHPALVEPTGDVVACRSQRAGQTTVLAVEQTSASMSGLAWWVHVVGAPGSERCQTTASASASDPDLVCPSF
jgi:hypothetical protein